MYEYLKGRMVQKNPAYVVIDCNGVGYFLNISLNTYSSLDNNESQLLYTHQVVKEDAHILFGFKTQEERAIFRNLLSVTGVGASTARMILSSLSPSEIQAAIASGSASSFQKIKGIGAKTAQKIIIDLSGKIEKLDLGVAGTSGKLRAEALSALVTLGFDKANAEKAVDKILASDNNLTVEQLIKSALKNI